MDARPLPIYINHDGMICAAAYDWQDLDLGHVFHGVSPSSIAYFHSPQNTRLTLWLTPHRIFTRYRI